MATEEQMQQLANEAIADLKDPLAAIGRLNEKVARLGGEHERDTQALQSVWDDFHIVEQKRDEAQAANAALAAALRDSLTARIEAAKRRSHEETRFCARCGMTCEILHKTRTFEFDDGKQVSWHNATDGDCWGQEEAARAALDALEVK